MAWNASRVSRCGWQCRLLGHQSSDVRRRAGEGNTLPSPHARRKTTLQASRPRSLYGTASASTASARRVDVKLESQSIDDLNEMAQAEFSDDSEAILALNQLYEAAKSCYLALFRLLRAKA